jgi:alcohol dehydrogenase
LARVLESPRDVEARARMQLGAAFSGLAIENSMLGAAHSAANPLTAHHGVVHGQAVGLMLPGVIEFNALLPEIETVYLDLAMHVGLRSVHDLASGVRKELTLAGLSAPLASFGVTADGIPALAEEAAKQWTAQFNPREIRAADFAKLYEEVL